MKKDNRKKILFIIPSLSGGGAERILLNLLKHLDRKMFIPHIVLLKQQGIYLDQLPKDVIIHDLKLPEKKQRNIFDIFKIITRMALKLYPRIKPDIVMSFIEDANLIAIMSRIISPHKPIIFISVRNYSSITQQFKRYRLLKKLLLKKLYIFADRIIAISKGIKKDLCNYYNIPEDKIVVIYNGIELQRINKMCNEKITEVPHYFENVPKIVACGRLTRQKNYPLLLNSFVKVNRTIKSILLILGEGIENSSLMNLANRLNISNDVFFLGFKKNPFKYMANADIFVLSSDFEGFPNVILESLACGTPVISTRCPSGPEEIITDGVNGLLVSVGNVDALAAAILQILKNKDIKSKLSKAGRKRAEDFEIKKMINEYKNIFEIYF